MKLLTLAVVLRIILAAEHAEVIKAVADWLDLTCIVLYHSDISEERHKIFSLLKTMFQNEGMKIVAVKNLQSEDVPYRYNKQRCSRMLHAIITSRDGARNQLEQISRRNFMNGPTWMIFLPNSTTCQEYLQNVNIPFNSDVIAVERSEEALILKQVYRVSMNHNLRTSLFATWTPEEGLVLTNGYTLFWHRDDLEGKVFKVSAIESWPLALLSHDNAVGGYFGKVWRELEDRLNFSTFYVKPKDFATGFWNEGRWNGLMGMILSGEVDAAISDITMTPERLPVVDFLRPLYTTRYQLFFKAPGMAIQWDLILRPFKLEVWLTLLFWLVLLTLLLAGGHRIGLKYKLEDPKYRREYESYHSLFFIASAFSQQANAIMPKSAFCRLILATSYVFSTIFVIIYSCTLTSMIAVQKPTRPFDSLESFLQDGTYNLQQIPGSDGYAYFSNSTEPVLQKIYKTLFSNLPQEELPKSHKSALERICETSKVAHMGEFGVTVLAAEELTQTKGCQFLFLQRPLKLLYLTMAITKDSPYKSAFDYQLEKMDFAGILNRFRSRNFPLWSKTRDVSFKPVSGEQTAQISVLFLTGVLSATCIFCGELLLKFYQTRR